MTAERDAAPRLGLAVLLFAVTFAVFAGALGNEFVAYDDDRYVTDNPFVLRGLTAETLVGAFREVREGNWHPLTWLSHALDVSLFGLDPRGHHAVGVGLHALNAALVFLLLQVSTGRAGAALAVTALWALHPLRVESVAWVAERKDVLSGALGLGALLAYVRWCRGAGRAALALAVALFVLGLLAKPMLVTLPVLLVLLDRWPLERGGEQRRLVWRDKLPFLGCAAVVALVTLLTQSAQGATASLETLPPGPRVANALAALGTYVRQTFLPVGLAPLVPHPVISGASQLLPTLVSGALVVGLGSLAWAWRRRAPWLAVGLAWYVVALLPVLGLVQVGLQAHADRYTYLPSIGLTLALVWSLRALPVPRAALLGAATLAAALLGALSWRQVARWQDTITLFEHTLAVTDRNPVALRLLGNAYLERGRPGDLERAIARYEAELALGHDRRVLLETLAPLYESVGDPERALATWRAATAGDPAPSLERLETIGRLQLATGRTHEAVETFRAVRARAPDDPIALHNLGNALERAGDLRGARDAYRAALAADPGFAASRARLDALSGADGGGA